MNTTKTTPAPMTNERIEAILNRLRALPDDEEIAVIWQTFGGIQNAAVKRPNTRVREFFDTMDRRIAEFEAKRASRAGAPLNQAQLAGCACVACSDSYRPMIPLGIETRSSTELFRCNRPECAVDPDVIRNRIPVAARVQPAAA